MPRWAVVFVALVLVFAGESNGEPADRGAAEPLRAVVNLDLPPSQRWLWFRSDPKFAAFKQDAIDYVLSFVSKLEFDLITAIASALHNTFYPEYAEEILSVAHGLDMSVGEAVLVNLIYQLESLVSKCSLMNTTGPCPPKPGWCTGVVANGQHAGDAVWQGRNLDWNLNAKLLKYVMQVDYQRSNRTVFTSVQVVGMVGAMHGVRPGAFSIQVNARDNGGNVLLNFLELILAGGQEPSHLLRRALEESTDFHAAEALLSGGRLANPCYFIMAGTNHGEGVILSRDRNDLADAWNLNEAPAKDTKGINLQPDWFRLQTNYDHWKPAPSWDDRRTPGVAHVKEFCATGVDPDCIFKVMTAWPTKNTNTDVTSIMCPRTGTINTTVWTHSAPSTVAIMV